MYRKLIQSAAGKRKHIPLDGTDAYRLFNSAGDGIDGLIIDRYGSYCLVQFFKEDLVPGVEEVSDALRACDLSFAPAGILLKTRMKSDLADPQSDYISECIWGDLPPENLVVHQNGIAVRVDLVRGMNTGLFLDMRTVRRKLESVYAENRPVRMLNLFCYTGAFSVHALQHGVSSAVNVDTSRTVLNRGMENYRLNGIEPSSRDFSCMDAGEYLRYAEKKGMKFDLVVFDPPTFSRGKKASFSVTRDYMEYLDRISRVSSGGLLLSVINTHSLSDAEYLSLHSGSFSGIFFEHEPDDFPPDGDFYLKAGLWRVAQN